MNGKEIAQKAKSQKYTSKIVTAILKKISTKIQKLVTGNDWNEVGNTGAIIDLVLTKIKLSNLLNLDKVDENTSGEIFEKGWIWEDDCVEMLRNEIAELKDHRGKTFKDLEVTEVTEVKNNQDLKEKIALEMSNYYNQKVKMNRNKFQIRQKISEIITKNTSQNISKIETTK
jgi:hypothetical protein